MMGRAAVLLMGCLLVGCGSGSPPDVGDGGRLGSGGVGEGGGAGVGGSAGGAGGSGGTANGIGGNGGVTGGTGGNGGVGGTTCEGATPNRCLDICVNLDVDPNNCGVCTRACGVDEVCAFGVCSPP